MSDVTTTYDRALTYARDLGAEHGRNAASWYFDGNTDGATYAAVLRGIEDGDPEILDTLPRPDLSGEWADTLTGPQLVTESLSAAGLSTCDGGATCDAFDGAAEEWFTDICDAYDEAFSEAVSDEIERTARYQTGGAA